MNDELPIRIKGKELENSIQVRSESKLHEEMETSPFNFASDHIQWGSPKQSHIRISFSHQAYTQVMQHASAILKTKRVEVGGILLGQVYIAQDNAYDLAIEHALADHDGISHSATFSFTHESWAALVKKAEQDFPTLRIVGWYHSHPNFGAFFSGTDENSQLTYFRTLWRVGLVVDPIRDEGLFYGLNNSYKLYKLPGFYERLDEPGHEQITWKNWDHVDLPPFSAHHNSAKDEPLEDYAPTSQFQGKIPRSSENSFQNYSIQGIVVFTLIGLIGVVCAVFFTAQLLQSSLKDTNRNVDILRATIEHLSAPPTSLTTPSTTEPKEIRTPTTVMTSLPPTLKP